MKKTSVFLTILLVVSLLFAVSCPNGNPTAKITAPTGDAAAITVTVGGEAATKEVVVELTDDTFNEEAFNVTAGNETVLDSWFTSSDTAKATVSAKIKTNGLEETATTKADDAKKYVKATVVLTVTPVAATAENTPVKVAFKIPAVQGDAKKWTASGKELTAENAIAITVNPQFPSAAQSPESVEIPGSSTVTGTSVILTLTGATWKNATPNLPTSLSLKGTSNVLDNCSYARDASDAHKLNVSLKAKASFGGGDFQSYDIDLVVPEAELEAETGYSVKGGMTITIKAQLMQN